MFRGDRLEEPRVGHGFSREKLAERLDVGYANIYRWEREERDPQGEVIAKIANLFNVSSDYLLGRTDNPGVYIDSDLSADERAAIAAWRRGDSLAAIRLIAAEK